MLRTLLQKLQVGTTRAANKSGRGRLFCSQPFTRFEVLGGGGKRGDVFFCCQSWLPKSIGNMHGSCRIQASGTTSQRIAISAYCT